MIDSFNIGVAAEFYAASILIELGYDVLLPFDRRGKYDLAAIDKKGKLLKFQVKRANWVSPKHTTSSYLRVQTTSKGTPYYKKDCDYFLFVCPEKRVWMVPTENLLGFKVITLDKKVATNRNWDTDQRFPSEKYRII